MAQFGGMTAIISYNGIVFDERTGHVREQRLAVFVGPVQAAVASTMVHVSLLRSFCFVRRHLRAVPLTLGP